MKRLFLISLFAFAVFPQNAWAHFVFIVPEPDGPGRARVIMSEDLEPDVDVPISIIGATKLSSRDWTGKETPLPLGEKGEHAFSLDLAGAGPQVVHGVTELGVQQRGNANPFLLLYFPKTIVGDAFEAEATLGADTAPIELIPVGKEGAVQFKLLAGGKPVSKSEVTVIVPGGDEKKATTDADGLTEVFSATGRYGAWARDFEETKGELGGKKYDQIRRYATLVADIGKSKASAESAKKSNASSPYPPLPQAASSFGAVACDGWLYVYGGHIVPTHSYSTDAVSGEFHRLRLDAGKNAKWETLPGGTKLQGMNLATHGGKVFRIGGMQPLNKPGDPADTVSVADVARFDPATKTWDVMPPLTQPRSSHDVVVIGDQMIVLGGWKMNGAGAATEWLDTVETLDLSNPSTGWKVSKQPFRRRALIAAVRDGTVYALGGFTKESDPLLRVDIYNPKTGEWTLGPDLPGKERNGFAPAACTVDGRLYVSVADGSLSRLSSNGDSWELIAKTTPRIVHRLVPFGSDILLLGGALKGDNLDLIESVSVKATTADASIGN